MIVIVIAVILLVAALILTVLQERGTTGSSPIIGGAPRGMRAISLPPSVRSAQGPRFWTEAYWAANWKTLLQRFSIFIAYALLLLAFALASPAFFTWSNHTNVWFSTAAIVVMSLGLILPLTSGDFDLSIASVMVLSAMMVAALNVWQGWPVGLAILAALAAGALVGAVNAFFIVYFRIHSLIVTLGVGTLINGVVIWFSKSNTISNVSFDLAAAMYERVFLKVPNNVWYTVIVAFALWYFLEYTAPGRRLLFVGRGREVARLAGIRVDRVRAGSLIACSMIAALAGVMYVGMTGSAEPINARAFVLPAFAGAFLGATCIYPGRFNPWGTLIGLYFLATGVNGLSLVGLPSFIQDLFYGGGLVIAVTLSQIVLKRQQQNF
ncbi:MAG: ABC transporter permease [Alphaproteobacteria bacterium]|nr:ABC transporter permease [Alphaproteobacteria bacterium]